MSAAVMNPPPAEALAWAAQAAGGRVVAVRELPSRWLANHAVQLKDGRRLVLRRYRVQASVDNRQASHGCASLRRASRLAGPGAACGRGRRRRRVLRRSRAADHPPGGLAARPGRGGRPALRGRAAPPAAADPRGARPAVGLPALLRPGPAGRAGLVGPAVAVAECARPAGRAGAGPARVLRAPRLPPGQHARRAGAWSASWTGPRRRGGRRRSTRGICTGTSFWTMACTSTAGTRGGTCGPWPTCCATSSPTKRSGSGWSATPPSGATVWRTFNDWSSEARKVAGR